MKLSRGLTAIYISILVSPILIVLNGIDKYQLPEGDEFFWSLKQTILQAVGSSLCSVALGLVMAFGLFKIQNFFSNYFNSEWIYNGLNNFLILPSLLPTMLSILVVLSFARPFPAGILGIIIVHTYIFSGFVAQSLFYIIRQNCAGLIETAYSLGATRAQIYLEIIKMLKTEVYNLLFLIFTISFASFSVPIAVGAGKGTTLEVLIYEKIRVSGNWGQAISICLFQVMFLFALSVFQNRQSTLIRTEKKFNFSEKEKASWLPWRWFGSRWGGLALLLYIAVFLFYLCSGAIMGWIEISKMPGLFQTIFITIPATFFMTIMTSIFVILFLFISAYLHHISILQNFLNGFVSPSLAIIGFSIVLLIPSELMYQQFLFCIGFSIFSLPSIYRFGLAPQLKVLYGQIEVAYVFGASRFLVFQKIILPQIIQTVFQLGGVVAIWVAGDFALSKYVFSEERMLGQITFGLMNSFKINPAMFVMFLSLFLGFVVMYLLMMVGHVFSKKSI